METKTNTQNSDNWANIEIAMEIIVGKWKPVILLHYLITKNYVLVNYKGRSRIFQKNVNESTA